MCVIVVAFVRMWLSSFWCGGWLYCYTTTFWFSSLWCDTYLCLGDLDEQSISDQRQEIKSLVVNILQNWSHRYSSHNSNIKCVGSTIKCTGFESIHYAINLNIVSSFMGFNDFDSIFLSMYC